MLIQSKEQKRIGYVPKNCEIYICSKCEYRHKRLSEMKNHCNTKHGKQRTSICNFKMDREDFSKTSLSIYICCNISF